MPAAVAQQRRPGSVWLAVVAWAVSVGTRQYSASKLLSGVPAAQVSEPGTCVVSAFMLLAAAETIMKAGASYERQMVEVLPQHKFDRGPWRPTETRTCPALEQSARRSWPLPSIGIQQNTNLVESFVISQFLEVAQQNAQPWMCPWWKPWLSYLPWVWSLWRWKGSAAGLRTAEDR